MTDALGVLVDRAARAIALREGYDDWESVPFSAKSSYRAEASTNLEPFLSDPVGVLEALAEQPQMCEKCDGRGAAEHDEHCDLLAWGDTSPGGDYGPLGYIPAGGFNCDCGAEPCATCGERGTLPLGVVGVLRAWLTATRECEKCEGHGKTVAHGTTFSNPAWPVTKTVYCACGSGRVPLVSVEEREAIICLLCEQVGWYDAAEGELIADDELHPNIPLTLGDAVARAVFVMAEGSMNE